jgi:hypothetical protein
VTVAIVEGNLRKKSIKDTGLSQTYPPHMHHQSTIAIDFHSSMGLPSVEAMA